MAKPREIRVLRAVILLSVLCISLPALLFGQTLELTLPPSAELPCDLSEWASNPALIHLAFTASDGMRFDDAHIVFEVTEGVEHVLVSTRGKATEQPSITGTLKKKNFKFNDIVGTEIDLDPMVRSASSSVGKLPGGLFSLCFYLVDTAGKQIGNISQACTNFTVRDIDPPVLLAPSNESVYSGKVPLAFSWSAANVLSQTVLYKLKLYPIYEGQSPEQAMAGSSAFYASDEIYSTSFLYPSDAPPLSSLPKAKAFAWTVTQMDQNEKPIGKNYGRSTPSVFYVTKN